MPFDATPTTITHSLAELSNVLRNKHLWPAGFEWDYGNCATCAMGLANELWNLQFSYYLQIYWSDMTAEYFDIPKATAAAIFLHMQIYGTHNITPEHVADAIDQYLRNV